MISVTRKAHIPNRTVAICWFRLLKWWATGPVSLAATGNPLVRVRGPVRVDAVRAALDDPQAVRHAVLVRPEVDLRQALEVVRAGRAGRLPLQPGRPPRVVPGVLAEEQRRRQVEGRHGEPDP